MFKPVNRYLLVERVEEELEKENSCILVPDDYKIAKKSAHGVYNVVDASDDCEKVLDCKNKKIVVDETMVQKIVLNKEAYYLVLENYVYGVQMT
jgi:co-chaperonin GroES (HSP10)